MKKYLREAVEEMQADNSQFHKDFKKQNEIIRRYDEIMAAKASKIALQALESQTNNHVEKEISDLTKFVNNTKENLLVEMKQISDFAQGLEESVNNTIEKKFKREKLRMGVQNPGTDILSSDGTSNLKKLMIMKADKVDIEKIYEIKSDKVDTNNMLEVQQLMSKQFKHILVLFIEVINLHSVRAGDTKGSVDKR